MNPSRPWRMRVLAVGVFTGVAAVVCVALNVGAPTTPSCYADPSHKCACPLAPGEKVLLPCSSVVDPQSCGVCSVVTAEGKRDGRSCIAIP